MPVAADRLFAPLPDAKPRRPLFAVLAITASVAVHGAALAAAIGFWGIEDPAPQPFEVVMVTVTRPSPAPAPDAAGGAPAPERAERGGPPAIAMPIAETVAPAVQAPLPVKAEASAPPPRPAPMQELPRMTSVAVTPPPATVAETAIQVAPVHEVDSPQPVKAAPAMADPPRPVARPATPPATAPSAGRQMAALPPAQPKPAAPSATTGPGPSAPSSSGSKTRPAEFSLGSTGNPAPDYPFRARQRGWEGRVVLRVAVDREGRPTRVIVAESSGHGVLDQAAHRTIASWVFRPATSAGRAIAGETLVPIVFRLN